MEFAFELTGSPDINRFDSYKLRFPKNTSVAEIVTYGMCNHRNFKVSIQKGAFEKNDVLVEFKNKQVYFINTDELRSLNRRLCEKVTVFSGCATLEFAVELSRCKTMMEWLNYIWKKARKKVILPIKA